MYHCWFTQTLEKMSTAYHAGHDFAYGLAGRRREMIATNLEKAKKARSGAPYTSRILKAGALIGDSKTLLSHWDVAATVDENVRRLHRDNIFGKASRSRVEDILAIFRRRYLSEKSVTTALVTLVRKKFPPASLERLLYFHSARADRLLHDAVTDVLLPMKQRGLMDIAVHDLQQPLERWVEQGKTVSGWSEITTLRVAQELLATLRDFGVLEGASKKRIAPVFLPVESFAYIAFYLKQHQPSGAKLIELPDWNLFFLNRESVERMLFEAHQHSLLEYHVAGSVTRLTFPTETLEEYANVLAQR
jgi:hypothetical protein